jgi:predicted Zn-dependent protease with MMP-like domain
VWRLKREDFTKVVGEALDSLPAEFRRRIRNVAVLVEDLPPDQPAPKRGQPTVLRLGLFHGVPMTRKSVFGLAGGPDYVVLYQKNIEAVCSSEAEVRHHPADGHPRDGTLFRDERGATERCLVS